MWFKSRWPESMTHFISKWHAVLQTEMICIRNLQYRHFSEKVWHSDLSHGHVHTLQDLLRHTGLFVQRPLLAVLAVCWRPRSPSALLRPQSAFCSQRKWCNRPLPLEWSGRWQHDSRRAACEAHRAVLGLWHVTMAAAHGWHHPGGFFFEHFTWVWM